MDFVRVERVSVCVIIRSHIWVGSIRPVDLRRNVLFRCYFSVNDGNEFNAFFQEVGISGLGYQLYMTVPVDRGLSVSTGNGGIEGGIRLDERHVLQAQFLKAEEFDRLGTGYSILLYDKRGSIVVVQYI